MAYVGAPSLEVREHWHPFVSAWSQGLQGPVNQTGPSPVQTALVGPLAADWTRGLALYGLSADAAKALGRQAEERKRAGQEFEDEDPDLG